MQIIFLVVQLQVGVHLEFFDVMQLAVALHVQQFHAVLAVAGITDLIVGFVLGGVSAARIVRRLRLVELTRKHCADEEEVFSLISCLLRDLRLVVSRWLNDSNCSACPRAKWVWSLMCGSN